MYILYYYSLCVLDTTDAVFYVGFFENWMGGNPSLLLMTTETNPVSYTIEAPGIGFYYNGTIVAGGEAVVNISDEIEMSLYSKGDKGICVRTSSNKVTLIGQNIGDNLSSGTFFALPFIGSCDNVYVTTECQ